MLLNIYLIYMLSALALYQLLYFVWLAFSRKKSFDLKKFNQKLNIIVWPSGKEDEIKYLFINN